MRSPLGLIQSVNRSRRRKRDRHDHQLGDPVTAGDVASLPTVIDKHHADLPAITGIDDTRGVDQPHPVPARQPATREHQPGVAFRYSHSHSGVNRGVLPRLQANRETSVQIKPCIGRMGATGRR